MDLPIAISIGDIAGIGPEVTLKALAAEANIDSSRYLLIGQGAHLRRLNSDLGLNLPLTDGAGAGGRIEILDLGGETLGPGLAPGSPEAARAAVSWVREGAALCLSGRASALVTAPVNKESIVRAGISFVGQTEMLSEMAGAKRTAMMLLGHDDRGRWLRVALATTHVPIARVSETLTMTKVLQAIELASEACGLLDLPRRRIAVCGLNPHAGEGGKMGTEELSVIEPAVRAATAKGLDVVGPLSADALFYYVLRGDYDAVVAMYHDQGLCPLKMVCFESGVNWTLGLPFIRTSPDHGTAYNIAGRNQAHAGSMIAAIRLAKKLARK